MSEFKPTKYNYYQTSNELLTAEAIGRGLIASVEEFKRPDAIDALKQWDIDHPDAFVEPPEDKTEDGETPKIQAHIERSYKVYPGAKFIKGVWRKPNGNECGYYENLSPEKADALRKEGKIY